MLICSRTSPVVEHVVRRAAPRLDNGSRQRFIQDDWRLGDRFVLNLGLRYDYYGQVKVRPTTDVPVEIVNYEAPTDLRKWTSVPLETR